MRATRPYRVTVARGAAGDLESIDRYVAADSSSAAIRLLDLLLSAVEELSSFPERGHFPKELLALGIREYRQIYLGKYRIVYKVVDRDVAILIIADGRRDMQALLSRRLLER